MGGLLSHLGGVLDVVLTLLGQLLELSRARLERLEGPEIPGDSFQSVQGVLEAKDPGGPGLGGVPPPRIVKI